MPGMTGKRHRKQRARARGSAPGAAAKVTAALVVADPLARTFISPLNQLIQLAIAEASDDRLGLCQA